MRPLIFTHQRLFPKTFRLHLQKRCAIAGWLCGSGKLRAAEAGTQGEASGWGTWSDSPVSQGTGGVSCGQWISRGTRRHVNMFEGAWRQICRTRTPSRLAAGTETSAVCRQAGTWGDCRHLRRTADAGAAQPNDLTFFIVLGTKFVCLDCKSCFKWPFDLQNLRCKICKSKQWWNSN